MVFVTEVCDNGGWYCTRTALDLSKLAESTYSVVVKDVIGNYGESIAIMVNQSNQSLLKKGDGITWRFDVHLFYCIRRY